MDSSGNASAVVSSPFNIDATPPVITCPAGGPFLLHSGDQPIGPAGVDASVSGLDEALSVLSGIVSTESVVGLKTITFSAADFAGNSASLECVYYVIFDFGETNPPVASAPALNLARAGSAIPIKFSLAGDQGLGIFAPGYPASQQVDCPTLGPAGPVELIKTAGKSGLSYDSETGFYNDPSALVFPVIPRKPAAGRSAGCAGWMRNRWQQEIFVDRPSGSGLVWRTSKFLLQGTGGISGLLTHVPVTSQVLPTDLIHR